MKRRSRMSGSAKQSFAAARGIRHCPAAVERRLGSRALRRRGAATGHVGEFVAAGSPVLRLVRVDPLRCAWRFPGVARPACRLDRRSGFPLEGDSRIYTGTIRRISPALDERTRMLVVEAELENPGMSCVRAPRQGEIVTASAAPHWRCRRSPGHLAGSEKVLLVSSNKVVERSITTGRKAGRLDRR